MKNILVIFWLLLISSSGMGQAPDYFGDSPGWRLNLFDVEPNGSNCICMINADYYYYVQGDTLIAGNNYNVIKLRESRTYTASGSGCTTPCPADYTVQDSIISFVRQDGRKVYHYDQMMGSDQLLIDYSLPIGDFMFIPHTQSVAQILGIDSVVVGSQWRRRFYLSDSNQDSSSWAIEGIGHFEFSSGTSEFLGYYEADIVPKPELWCFSEQGLTLWTNPEYTSVSCDSLTGVHEAFKSYPLTVFPNPASDQINVRSGVQIDRLELRNIRGQLVIDRKEKHRKESSFDIGDLPSGVYVLTVYFDNGERVARKVVRE